MASIFKICDGAQRKSITNSNLIIGTKVTLRAADGVGGVGIVTKIIGKYTVCVKWPSGCSMIEYASSLKKVQQET